MSATATVQTRTTGQPGRYILSAEGRHLVVDASAMTGGVAEAFVAQELLVGALATCAQAVVFAKGEEYDLRPSSVTVTVESDRDPEASPPVYSSIVMDFVVEGLAQEDAQRLVDEFTSLCPIYYTVSQAAPMTVTVRVTP